MSKIKTRDYALRKKLGSEAIGGLSTRAETICRVGDFANIGSTTPAKGRRHCRES